MTELVIFDVLTRSLINKSLWRLVDRDNPFNWTNIEFQNRFRLSKDAVYYLIGTLKPLLNLEGNGYSAEMQILTVLRLFAAGSFQNVIGDGMFSQIAQSSVSRFLDRFLCAMMMKKCDFIRFPYSQDAIDSVKRKFYNSYNFPSVVGAIDCTHIVIQRPSLWDWNSFLNRKNKFSLNVQMVCDSEMRILDVITRWPGSTHDSLIWHFSGVRRLLETHPPLKDCFLIGDSGYPLEPYLMTPYLNPEAPQEERFNSIHRRTRNVVERTFGLLKSRFRILSESGGTLVYTPGKTGKIVMAAAMLHNICLQHGMENIEISDDEYDEDDIHPGNIATGNAIASAILIRDSLAMAFQLRS